MSELSKLSPYFLFNVMPVQTGIQIKLKNRQFLAGFWIPARACPREGGGGNDEVAVNFNL